MQLFVCISAFLAIDKLSKNLLRKYLILIVAFNLVSKHKYLVTSQNEYFNRKFNSSHPINRTMGYIQKMKDH